MVKLIDDHRDAHGVEPICKMLPIAPATYYDHLAERADPARLSGRVKRDEALRPHIQRVFDANCQVYGAFVVDAYARRIVGWCVSTSPHARFVLDALEQAVHECRPVKSMGLVHHSDRG